MDDRWMGGLMGDGWMVGWMMDRWVGGWMGDRQMDLWMDGWMTHVGDQGGDWDPSLECTCGHRHTDPRSAHTEKQTLAHRIRTLRALKALTHTRHTPHTLYMQRHAPTRKDSDTQSQNIHTHPRPDPRVVDAIMSPKTSTSSFLKPGICFLFYYYYMGKGPLQA